MTPPEECDCHAHDVLAAQPYVTHSLILRHTPDQRRDQSDVGEEANISSRHTEDETFMYPTM